MKIQIKVFMERTFVIFQLVPKSLNERPDRNVVLVVGRRLEKDAEKVLKLLVQLPENRNKTQICYLFQHFSSSQNILVAWD